MKNQHVMHIIIKLLLILGGLTWGLIGLFQFNLIEAVLGEMSTVTRVVYVLIGIAAAYKAIMWAKHKTK